LWIPIKEGIAKTIGGEREGDFTDNFNTYYECFCFGVGVCVVISVEFISKFWWLCGFVGWKKSKGVNNTREKVEWVAM
jgi:hypothetical protein